MEKKKVLSGIRATGRLHLGNYYGAVKGMIELQNNKEYETFYMVADLHTLTTPYNIEELKKNRFEVVLDYLAAGIDPEKSVIFFQSDVLEHTELAFLLSTVISISRMQHLPTYKDKVKQYPKDNTMALLNYPVLMAADILLYKASLVPVGLDQEPHLEVAREIANKMNNLYGTDFPEPKRYITKGEYIPSLTGEGKMSKTQEGSYINLIDDLNTIENKIAKIPTDSGHGTFENSSNGIKTLFKLIELFQGADVFNKIKLEYETKNLKYQEIKKELSQSIFRELEPLQRKRKLLEKDLENIKQILNQGAVKAQIVARTTLSDVKNKMGFVL